MDLVVILFPLFALWTGDVELWLCGIYMYLVVSNMGKTKASLLSDLASLSVITGASVKHRYAFISFSNQNLRWHNHLASASTLQFCRGHCMVPVLVSMFSKRWCHGNTRILCQRVRMRKNNLQFARVGFDYECGTSCHPRSGDYTEWKHCIRMSRLIWNFGMRWAIIAAFYLLILTHVVGNNQQYVWW